MAIVRADLQDIYRPQVVSDTLSNGGRMTHNVIPNATIGNLFSPAGQAELTAGSVRNRKAFYKNSNIEIPIGATPTGIALQFARVFVEKFTPGEDDMMIFLGTQLDTENDLTGSEPVYGCGQLETDAPGGSSSIEVAVHDWATYEIFRNSDLIRLSNKADIDASGQTEFIRIHPATAISALGDIVTLPLETNLVQSFLAANTRVCSVIEAGIVVGAFDTFVVTSGLSGTYNEIANPVEHDNQGTIQQAWTLTFSNATNYQLSGDTLGVVSSGTVGADFAPTNPNFGRPYFTLRSAGFGGTFQNGDTIDFNTSPASVPIWAKRDIPAGSVSSSNNEARVQFEGESS